MPPERIADEIRKSLAEGERFEDFAFMFDALVFLRAPYNTNLGLTEDILKKIICFVLLKKPQNYVRAMQAFRLGFAGVAANPELQGEFSNSVRRAAITVNRPEDVVWRPSLYFALPPRLREQKDLREWWF